ncbi:MAG: DUF1501 domain-containing protein [Pseudomonadota bacterium]
MTLTRRTFLTDALAATALGSGLGLPFATRSAQAADTSGYRALVCVFLFGGLDNHDTVLPYDSASYNSFAAVRSSLLQAQGANRARTALLPLTTTDPTQFGSRQFALPPELAGIKGLYDQGNAAIIGNVGPLIQPTTRLAFEQESVLLPPRLFSHNDQQATWQSSSPEGAVFGWGGRFMDAMIEAGANSRLPFSTITSGGGELFLTGSRARPYQISPAGAAVVELLADAAALRNEPGGEVFYQQALALLRSEQYTGSHLLERDIASSVRGAIDSNALYNQALASAPSLTTTFPASGLSAQLRAVAQAISVRSALGANRQVFTVAMGGFDTHSQQATSLPALLGEIDAAVTAFYSEMVAQGLANDVTLFTASDFGRTLAVNGDGTDHGWGGHHFVVGGSVNGGAIYGDLPPATVGHEWDSGGGRLIPTTAVEQMAAPLGRWFGLNATEIAAALPNLANFSSASSLAFI